MLTYIIVPIYITELKKKETELILWHPHKYVQEKHGIPGMQYFPYEISSCGGIFPTRIAEDYDFSVFS